MRRDERMVRFLFYLIFVPAHVTCGQSGTGTSATGTARIRYTCCCRSAIRRRVRSHWGSKETTEKVRVGLIGIRTASARIDWVVLCCPGQEYPTIFPSLDVFRSLVGCVAKQWTPTAQHTEARPRPTFGCFAPFGLPLVSRRKKYCLFCGRLMHAD
jgi:hypothetical protein